MSYCSFACEVFAFIIVFIISLFFYDAKAPRTSYLRRRVYGCALALCAASVVIDTLCGYLEGRIDLCSTWTLTMLHTIYFLVLWGMICMLAHYLILRLYEFINNEKSLQWSQVIVFSIFAFFVVLLIHNIKSGELFFVDQMGIYLAGPRKNITYLMPVLEILVVLIMYIVNQNNITSSTKKILLVIGPIALSLLLFDAAYPEHQLNGLICATVTLVIFIGYQGGRSDQDTLTGLPNRECFLTEVKYRTRRHERYQLVLIKLRGLHKMNALYGGAAGNNIILQLAKAIQNLSEDARPFRYADGEFVLVFSGNEPTLCADRLKSVERIAQRSWAIEGTRLQAEFSLIEIIHEEQMWDINDIQAYLSEACYQASQAEIPVMPFDESMIKEKQKRDRVLSSMKNAFSDNRFEVWYQPVYYHNSEKFESAEALIRMYSEDGELISPDDFIPIAEESSFIDKITLYVLDNACKLLASEKIRDLEKICINVPAKQIIDRPFFLSLLDKIKSYGLSLDSIRFEITERDMEEKGDSASRAMRKLTTEGACFMLDDFGMGYSNFSRVIDMTLDGIKLDRSLVVQMAKEDHHYRLIKNYLIPIMHEVGHFIVAEGVENEEMLKQVLSCNITRIQGFYFAKPMPEDDLVNWYRGGAVSIVKVS